MMCSTRESALRHNNVEQEQESGDSVQVDDGWIHSGLPHIMHDKDNFIKVTKIMCLKSDQN